MDTESILSKLDEITALLELSCRPAAGNFKPSGRSEQPRSG